MSQRTSQLSPSCPGVEETVLEMSAPCSDLGKCLSLTWLQTQEAQWVGSVVGREERDGRVTDWLRVRAFWGRLGSSPPPPNPRLSSPTI